MPEMATRVSRKLTALQSPVIGAVSLFLLAASYLPLGVSISVSVHGFGDVSGALGTLWRLTTGTATFASLVFSYRSFRSQNGDGRDGPDESPGPDTIVNVDGGDGNVTLNFTLAEGDVESIRTAVEETENRSGTSEER